MSNLGTFRTGGAFCQIFKQDSIPGQKHLFKRTCIVGFDMICDETGHFLIFGVLSLILCFVTLQEEPAIECGCIVYLLGCTRGIIVNSPVAARSRIPITTREHCQPNPDFIFHGASNPTVTVLMYWYWSTSVYKE